MFMNSVLVNQCSADLVKQSLRSLLCWCQLTSPPQGHPVGLTCPADLHLLIAAENTKVGRTHTTHSATSEYTRKYHTGLNWW